jgi:hypothetical protein
VDQRPPHRHEIHETARARLEETAPHTPNPLPTQPPLTFASEAGRVLEWIDVFD